MATAVTQAGGEIIRLPMASKNPVTMFANARRLAKLVTDHHVRSRAPAWSAFLAARWTGRPFVTTYHGSYSSRAPLKMFYSGVMARGDRVIANSRYTAGLIAAQHHVPLERMRVVYAASTSHALPPARSRRTASMRFELHGASSKAGRSFCMQPG